MDTATRRKLLKTGLAAALFAAGGMPVAAGARSGGRLRVGLSGRPGGHRWTPQAGFGLFQSLTGAGLLFDTLTEIAPDGLLQGSLATVWAPSRGGAVWTVDLDPEARFHHGPGLVAEDVIASLDLHLAPGAPGFGLRALVARMEALSPHRIRFALHAPNADFPYLLSDPVLLIGPAAGLADAFAQGVGTGPYRLVSFDGDRLLAERVGAPSGEGAGNWFDTVEVLALPDADHRARALLEGRVDVIDRVPQAQLARLARARGLEVLALPATEYIELTAGPAGSPMAQTALLRGLRAGLDRGALARAEGLRPALAHTGDPEAARAELARFAGRPLHLAMDPDLGAEGARVVGALAGQLRGLGMAPTLAGPGTPAHLRVRRGPMRATLDWTLRIALRGPGGTTPVAGRWALPAERPELLARAVEAGPALILAVGDANLVVSDRVGRPDRTGEGWDLAHARLARRWWRS